MLARTTTFAIVGHDPQPVTVEVDVRAGLPSFAVVGLGDAAVRESRERVRAALLNSGFEFPMRRVTANLAPAHLPKTGPGFDLALAMAVLVGSGQLEAAALDDVAVHGELSLGGELRPVRGTLVVAEGARRAGVRRLVIAHERAGEARLVDGLDVVGAADLTEAVEVLAGRRSPRAAEPEGSPAERHVPDLADVRGHAAAIRALVVAAAGGHNLFLEGPPGTGKTMLARRLPGILPPLSREEALEVTRIHSVAGLHRGDGLVGDRPFRAPHHTISPPGLVGGGAGPTAGEVTLAHRGVLFLDELSEFSRNALEALRQPLEDGEVTIVRGQRSLTMPARATLIAAANPCPCGHGGEQCRCAAADVHRHRRKLSGPLLDRIDLVVTVGRPSAEELEAPPVTNSGEAKILVLEARERQARRLAGTGATCNGELGPAPARRLIDLSDPARTQVRDAYTQRLLSPRGRHRLLRVARTLADLDGARRVERPHVLEALGLRPVPTGVAA
jgi:magnesium chelatase family protein